jgi:hypothetical protein
LSKFLYNLWARHSWGERKRHQDIDDIFGRLETISAFDGLSENTYICGIYLIGCGDRIVYIGQSIHIRHRSIESLARIYYQIEDKTLPWSIGFIPYDYPEVGEDLNELESTAIRKFAPIFNTSIPSKLKSQGKEPMVMHIAQVFADEENYCTAFESENLKEQTIEAKNNPSPPWQQGNKRRRKWNTITNQYELLEKYKED